MSLNVPEIISKEEYKKLTNKTLNAPDFQQYKRIFDTEQAQEDN